MPIQHNEDDIDILTLAIAKKQGGGGGGGTTNYNNLENKPSVNNHTLEGSMTAADLELPSLEDAEQINAVQSNGTLPSLSVDNEGYIHFNPGALATLKSINVIVNPIKIPSWSTGTWEEIQEVLAQYYAGEIDLTQEWQIGDERVVELAAIPTILNFTDTHPAQSVKYVLTQAGGETIVSGTYTGSTCAFQVDQKSVLGTNGTAEEVDLIWTNQTYYSEYFSTYPRYQWLNGRYFMNGMPSALKNLVKSFTPEGLDNPSSNTKVYVRSLKQLGLASVQDPSDIIEYYKTPANRIKKVGVEELGTGAEYWTVDCAEVNPTGEITSAYNVTDGQTVSSKIANKLSGIAPYFII